MACGPTRDEWRFYYSPPDGFPQHNDLSLQPLHGLDDPRGGFGPRAEAVTEIHGCQRLHVVKLFLVWRG